ncbi:Bug family tripartite tricarboxylate transporter substrate binding protein [Microvirga soli]|uniref:Bug family tripartite tricarboxylate transporter substrate binding protein n=1 Tax=Microvirga soli TaxID=1854496 RepID=UPI00191CA6FE|nr:tripartite tricarboxylate transporter substrate binding protein [Microvirga soli]
MLKGKALAFVTSAILALASIAAGSAAAYPDRVITIVVPYAAGGPTDVAARIIADEMSKDLGQSVVVENRPGAGTVVGTEAVARAQKDGHTLLVTAATTFSTNPHTIKNIRYKLEDFAPISLLARVPFVFVVKNGFSAKDVKEFVAYAKASPDGVDLGTLGAGTVPHIIGGMMDAALGIKLTPIPYGGAAPILSDILGGNLDSYIASVADAAPNHKEGRYRVLASLSAERPPQLPDIPTFVELGYKDLVGDSWFAAFAPAGTTDEIIRILNKAMVKAVASGAYQERMNQLGNTPVSSTPEELQAFVTSESQRWGKMIKALGIESK